VSFQLIAGRVKSFGHLGTHKKKKKKNIEYENSSSTIRGMARGIEIMKTTTSE
jgi:hypothetical protein